ncbi:MAG: hypothetical protein K5905_26390 [Roseibium sp.]|uniref:hypothetical protein n=1 Tax=Roseibium sp. TaxID=1936156 RepID=UPI00261BD6FA|nr:hypothetical protein [Roseibium sp.]MCV0428999.1 hypothetical protein [Roseibium sp.]
MSETPKMDLTSASPPANFSPERQALWWLKKGNLSLGPEWQKAHEICQSFEGEKTHDWIHALCHLIERDYGNAAYWFRRAGKPSNTRDAEKVWQEIAETA